ncbi:MAG TPA: hypothetical protein VHQ00_15200, partial [Chloroflexota bacterium]|nr:hypothetical protein [Chloroflexota bacterium]
MYRRITMTAIMLTLLGGRARQTHATPAGTLGPRRRRTRDIVSYPKKAFIALFLLSGWLMMLASWGSSDAAPT